MRNDDKTRPADLLLLSGQPLREPVVATGTWVFNSWNEVIDDDDGDDLCDCRTMEGLIL